MTLAHPSILDAASLDGVDPNDPDAHILRSGFTRVLDDLVPGRIILAVWSLEGAGKTRLAIGTSPRPTVVFNFDLGASEVANLLPDSSEPGRVYHRKYVSNDPDFPVQEGERIIAEFRRDFLWTVRNVRSGTIVFDTISAVQTIKEKVELAHAVEGRKDKKTYGFDRKQINAFWENFPKILVNTGLSVVYIGKATEIWDESGKPTGEYRARWPDAVPYHAQIVGRLHYEPDVTNLEGGHIRRFRFSKNRFDPTWVGTNKDLKGPDVDFDTMLQMFAPKRR